MNWQDIKIEDLELSVRSYNCLRNVQHYPKARSGIDTDGIRTLGELVLHTEAELIKAPNFGRKSLREVKEILADSGLWLGMTPEEIAAKTVVETPTIPDWDRVIEAWEHPAPMKTLITPWTDDVYRSARWDHAVYLRMVERKTYTQMGVSLGVSQERARQIAYVGARRVARLLWGKRSYYFDGRVQTLEGE